VDDETYIRMLYKGLQNDGYEVVGGCRTWRKRSGNGVESPDVIILDIELGDDNGLQLSTACARNTATAALFMNSAYSTYKSVFPTWLPTPTS